MEWRMKNNLKNYKFWLAVLASVIVLINTLGAVFGFSVDEVAITSIATAVLGIFVAIGFVNKTEEQNQTEQNVKNEIAEQNQQEQNDKNTISNSSDDTKPNKDETIIKDLDNQNLQNGQNDDKNHQVE